MNRRTALFLVLAAALAGAATAWMMTRRAAAPQALEQATLFDAARPVPQFELADQAGRPFNRDSLRGQWTLMFFGFTNCPDVCPTTLATLADARRLLADLPAAELPVVALVTVDPARDTPQALGRYVAHFDEHFLGVTGSPEAIEVLTHDLGVAVSIGPESEDGYYTVDHTAAIFLIDPAAAFTAVFGSPHAADVIARDYRSIVKARD
ncbi:MAG: SCO family protein [Gammaproteobacteria bacterium]|nr:SCO family protein [Gammaproteobacteria bacterium]